ncbi:MAG: AAA family ATPase [Planctomycetales bacterium]|nr:AAA family ATPase [Planctomycetales bacterium]
MRSPTDDPFIRSVSLNRQFVPSFDVYPYSIPAIKNLTTLELHKNVTFFVGENGTGKSTLLEAMAVAEGFNAEGGSRHAMFKTRDTHSEGLARNLQLARPGRKLARSDSFFLRAESFYNLSSYVDDLGGGSYGPIPLHQQSHGEAFLTILTTRLGGNGLYLFDEPEAALSPQRQLTFLVGLHELVKAGSQLIIATHSPIIMAYPNALIYHFTTEGIAPIAYEETEHYKVTKAFMTRTELMLGELLE